MKVTAIFDIGKTNKKFFLFDKNFKEVYKTYAQFPEIGDEDGFPCDDLQAISQWISQTLEVIFRQEKYTIEAINFSTYGASFVHVDKAGKALTPLYNYLKPYPEKLLKSFYDKYGAVSTLARETASPQLGMLNSGMQLYWLKHTQPEIFEQVRWSLHLPQYLSFLITGLAVSDFTSIGCHTNLWDFNKNDYHQWVYEEAIDQKLAPALSTSTSINTQLFGKKVKVGIGIHDSSAALLPYLKADKKPFLLISTGTWSIALNPFNQEALKDRELEQDCLNFLRIDGIPTKAARLFLGNEYSLQLKTLQQHFKVASDAHQKVCFNPEIYDQLIKKKQRFFHFESISLERNQPENTQLNALPDFEMAYHQLMIELVKLQIEAAERAIGKTSINKLYIDGGFAQNELYIQLLSKHFTELKIRTTYSPLGSALGAAVVIANEDIKKNFLKKHYAMKKVSGKNKPESTQK